MSFLDFHPRRRIVQTADGRRFVCRAPTHATIVRLVELLPLAIVKCVEVIKAAPEPLTAEQLLPLFLEERDEAAEVLGTCCELWRGAPGEFEAQVSQDRDLLVALALSVVALCDPVRIAKALNLDTMEAPEGREEGEPDGMEAAYVLLAERFGISPMEIPTWPYEALLSVKDAIQHIEEGRAERIREAQGGGRSSGGKVVSMPLDGPSPVGGVIRKVRPRPVRRG